MTWRTIWIQDTADQLTGFLSSDFGPPSEYHWTTRNKSTIWKPDQSGIQMITIMGILNVIVTPCSVSLAVWQIPYKKNTSIHTGNFRDSRVSIYGFFRCWKATADKQTKERMQLQKYLQNFKTSLCWNANTDPISCGDLQPENAQLLTGKK